MDMQSLRTRKVGNFYKTSALGIGIGSGSEEGLKSVLAMKSEATSSSEGSFRITTKIGSVRTSAPCCLMRFGNVVTTDSPKAKRSFCSHRNLRLDQWMVIKP